LDTIPCFMRLTADVDSVPIPLAKRTPPLGFGNSVR
jgi:hypothetical protein